MPESSIRACMARCSDPAVTRLSVFDLCRRHYERVLHAAQIALEIEDEQRNGPLEWRANAPAVVYYIRRLSDGLIKIGRTARFSHRVSGLRAEHGELQILLTHPGGKEEEADMHWRFRALRVEGEFFRPRKPLVNWIISIRQQQGRETLLPGTVPMPVLLALAAPKRMAR